MESQYEEISRWKDWSLEDTCSLLRKRFPASAIWIVRPCNMLRYLFSCFHNFVKSSITGVPEYSRDHGAVPHLHYLLKDAIRQVRAGGGGLELGEEEMASLPLTIIGFSKGCVVLNQLLHELGSYVGVVDGCQATSHATEEGRLRAFVHQIRAIYWLDAGHSGEREAWVTDDKLLDSLAALRAEVHVHVTPHQVRCPARPWIGEEEKLFVTKLKERGVKLVEKVHFDEEQRSLLNHFRVLNVF